VGAGAAALNPTAADLRTDLLKRIAPTLLAAALAAVYIIVSPPSEDLAAHLLRAKLFSAEGFGIWNNWWYAGHNVPGYSVLFPPIGAAITPQVAGAIAATASAAVFEPIARRRFGPDAWLGALWFGAATATSLFTGRLTFAFGALPGLGAVLALQRRRTGIAAALAVTAALASPVDALFVALVGAADAIGAYVPQRRIRPALGGLAVAAGALVPVLVLAVVFPEGGTEPFAFSAMWPIVIVAIALFFAAPRHDVALRAGAALYALGCILSYAVATPVGSNATRLAPLVAGPIAALIWWRRRNALLVAVALPLLYLQWQAPYRDWSMADGDAGASVAYYQPLNAYLSRQSGPPFRIEIPFTQTHWESYAVAPRFPLARGWERQLDLKDNPLFYDGRLTPATYDAWLHSLAVRFVAVSDADLDYSAVQEQAMIDRGLPYLHLVHRTRHWRVYAVSDPTPIVSGAATLRALGPNSLTLNARRAGVAFVRVRFSPYWALTKGSGCVAPDGDFTKLTLRRAGPAELGIHFSLDRIGARSPRCT
jgi:hypothetical protein